MIEAVTFDLWNTIFSNISYTNERLSLLSKFLDKNHIPYDEISLKKEFYKYFDFSSWNKKEIAIKHIYTLERFQNMIFNLNINLTSHMIHKMVKRMENIMFKRRPALKKNAKETIENLASDYKIGLISDTGITPGRVIRKTLKEYKLLKYFDVTIFSDETGLYKPNPMVFRLALDKLKTKAEKTVHVGDLLMTDIKGARSSNIISIWINDKNKKSDPNIKPNFEIKDLFEVVNIIRNKIS